MASDDGLPLQQPLKEFSASVAFSAATEFSCKRLLATSSLLQTRPVLARLLPKVWLTVSPLLASGTPAVGSGHRHEL